MKKLIAILTLSSYACGNISSVPNCTVSQTSTGATISCPNGTSATVPNGTNGASGPQGIPGPSGSPGPQGSPGPTPSLGPDTPMWLIAPCGQASSPYKEQLMCLNNGSLLSSFSDSTSGNETRFALIPVGTYEDTDDSGCVFTVSLASDGVSTIVSWNAGSGQYSTWVAGSQTCQAN